MRNSIHGLTAAVALFATIQFACAWPDSFAGRNDVQTLIARLNADLLASRSATITLAHWCADHHIAAPATIVAIQDRHAFKPATAAQRAELAVGPDEPLRYRHVQLACGAHVLSDAENWYVPARLTPDMNRALDSTDTPFGLVVAPLRPSRKTLASQRLWSPLRAGRTHSDASHAPDSVTLAIPAYLFRHRAIVLDGQHRPIAEVVETYTRAVLDFGR